MKQRFFGALLLFVVMVAPAAVEAAPILWTNGHYYEVVASGAVTWDDANAWASSLSYAGKTGYLASSTSASENAFITSLAGGHLELWLGGFQNPLTETDPNANWTWTSGELWAYTNWGGRRAQRQRRPRQRAVPGFVGDELGGPRLLERRVVRPEHHGLRRGITASPSRARSCSWGWASWRPPSAPDAPGRRFRPFLVGPLVEGLECPRPAAREAPTIFEASAVPR